jgi:hypothetical protein
MGTARDWITGAETSTVLIAASAAGLGLEESGITLILV